MQHHRGRLFGSILAVGLSGLVIAGCGSNEEGTIRVQSPAETTKGVLSVAQPSSTNGPVATEGITAVPKPRANAGRNPR